MNRNKFAEKIVNNLPWVKNLKVKVTITNNCKNFKPQKEGEFINYDERLFEYLNGVIDGIRYAYDVLFKKGGKNVDKA